MTQIIRYVQIKAWSDRKSVETLGDVSGMVQEPSISTVMGGRAALVDIWCDEVSGDGWERITTTLHDWE